MISSGIINPDLLNNKTKHEFLSLSADLHRYWILDQDGCSDIATEAWFQPVATERVYKGDRCSQQV